MNEKPAESLEDLLRRLAPQVLGALMRRYGRFDTAEDAVQEALLAAATQWPAEGVPDNPYGWLVTAATRRFIDWVRSDAARRRREDADVAAVPPSEFVVPGADEAPAGDQDDSLKLLFLCCHPSLSTPSQIALTSRAVGGLTTAEIAHAFFVPESTMAQRISRAKQSIRKAGATFDLPPAGERAERLKAVLHVLYLMFNEGYTVTAGPDLQRDDLTADALRLTRLVHRLLPEDGEVAGLLALMLLTEARARTRELGPYQIQAAIAAVHDEAARVEDTDWPQVLALYGLLERIAPNPMVTLSKAVADAMVSGPGAGLAIVAELEADDRMARHHRLDAVRAHLLEMADRRQDALTSYRTASRYATSVPEKRYLDTRAAKLADADPAGLR
ncbi:RNA polymerase sigma factor [Actinomadura rudentiformis]|uniref:Sigma-70 family RNA polymerase sigma factor n=1 Tax=Actinomadura rudentiformis TaxID=359158 RepID=A0A6H9YJ32_9ACTN|nr:sigma-70 family RNA polymerase sigma factor [Actinomadura rudentiformis]KAB2346095.1 sigma-70 family RNA polymerase sigma factor [Actinomadura rudentiformis]